MSNPEFVHTTYIETSAEKLWQALTDGDFTERYWFGHRVSSDWEAGSLYRFVRQGANSIEGSVLTSEPCKRLVYTWNPCLPETQRERTSRVTFDLESRGKRAIFSGDALHNPVQVPIWKWNSVFCEDRDQARKTRHTLLADCVEQDALLMPAHFGSPHAAYIKASGDGFALDWDHDNKRGR